MRSRFECADACNACHDICSQELLKLMDLTPPRRLDDLAIEALIQCAAICQTASRVLRGQHGFADVIRLTCASKCEECAKLLEPYEQMNDCVEAAFLCAAICRDTCTSR